MGQSVTWHDRRWQQALQAQGLRTYEDFMDVRPGELVWERSVTKTFRLTAEDPEKRGRVAFYLKKYVYPAQRWRFLFRRDKPSVERRNYELLRRHVGAIVPEVVATGRRRRWLTLHGAFILTTALPECVQLDDYARARWSSDVGPEERARQDSLIRVTAELVRRMHAAHFYHMDLQWRNVLVRFGESPQDAETFFIDAPRGGLRWLWLRRRHGRVRDLSSLDKFGLRFLTRTQRLRWFRLYTGHRRINRSDRRLIEAVMAEHARYERKRVRQLTIDE